jgi:hypothetical protein
LLLLAARELGKALVSVLEALGDGSFIHRGASKSEPTISRVVGHGFDTSSGLPRMESFLQMGKDAVKSSNAA